MDNYLLTIVLPTRDRPDLVESCLRTIVRQDLRNVEVIVSDNGICYSCEGVVKKYAGYGIKYKHTDGDYPLKGSFEFATGLAKGDWVIVLEDKDLLHTDALKKIKKILIERAPDILNYPTNLFEPFNIDKDIFSGILVAPKKTKELREIQTENALATHFQCDDLFLSVKNKFSYGSILGGAYKKELIEKIKRSHDSGMLYDGAVPDRYLTIEALYHAKKVMFIDDDIVTFNVCHRNTWKLNVNKTREEIIRPFKNSRNGCVNVDKLVIPDVYTSLSNILATDYCMARDYVIEKGISSRYFSIERWKIAGIAYFEVVNANVSEAVKKIEQNNLNNFINKMSVEEKTKYEIYRQNIINKQKRNRLKRSVCQIVKKWIGSDVLMLRKVGTAILQCRRGQDYVLSKDVFSVL